MRIQAALLATACAALSVMGQGCGPGTYLEKSTNMCMAGVDPRLQRRADSGGPSIRTDDGNVVIAVNGAGKQIGYRIGDADIVYFDQMDSSIRGQVPAIELGYRLGEQSKGTSSILDYLKTDLSDRVSEIAGAQTKIEAAVQTSLDAASGKTTQQLLSAETKTAKQLADQKKDVDTKISTLTATVTADLKETKDTIDKEVVTQLTKSKGDLEVQGKKLACLNQNLKFNPENGECCALYSSWNAKTKKCVLPIGRGKDHPAKNCQDVMDSINNPQDDFYWLKPTSSVAAFQAWCTFKGDYKGSALVIRNPGNTANMERVSIARSTPCALTGNSDSKKYCKISDAQINALVVASKEKDPYISLAYKSASLAATPFCRSYARKSCKWTMAGQSHGDCANTPVRNSGRYCRRTNANSGYRGMDGYYCNNGVSYNSGNPHPNSGIHENNRPFVIFEHNGGRHYCGGHDTTWKKVELWIQ